MFNLIIGKELNSEEIEFGRKLFCRSAEFIAGVQKLEQFPSFSLPEVAIIGKSNVGKSSLINFITNRKDLARTSKRPGATKQINFFNIAEKLILVDLPGYGYAKVSYKERNNWGKLILHYLEKSINLQEVFLLIDARRLMAENDFRIIDILLRLNIKFTFVLTKIDKALEKDKLIAQIKSLKLKNIVIILSSVMRKQGAEQLRACMGEYGK